MGGSREKVGITGRQGRWVGGWVGKKSWDHRSSGRVCGSREKVGIMGRQGGWVGREKKLGSWVLKVDGGGWWWVVLVRISCCGVFEYSANSYPKHFVPKVTTVIPNISSWTEGGRPRIKDGIRKCKFKNTEF